MKMFTPILYLKTLISLAVDWTNGKNKKIDSVFAILWTLKNKCNRQANQ